MALWREYPQTAPIGSRCLDLGNIQYVVDPGVGTHRRASVAKLKNGCYVVTPDNGTLTHLYYNIGIEAIREIDETVNRLKGTEGTSIFHGRDLFAYCAGKLAAGLIDFEGVGPEYPVREVVVHDKLFNPDVQPNCAQGIITQAIRQFGNLNTNISGIGQKLLETWHWQVFDNGGKKDATI